MGRCPCCNARLSAEPVCPRCKADLGPVLRSEQMAGLWLSLSLQALQAGRPEIAVRAVNRSLSFKQTRQARVFREFLIRHQYNALYDHLAKLQWQNARQALSCLHVLQGDIETLSRFKELIDHAVNMLGENRELAPEGSSEEAVHTSPWLGDSI